MFVTKQDITYFPVHFVDIHVKYIKFVFNPLMLFMLLLLHLIVVELLLLKMIYTNELS